MPTYKSFSYCSLKSFIVKKTSNVEGEIGAWLGLAWLGLAWLGLAWLGLAWLVNV